jgi:hypothetical protein
VSPQTVIVSVQIWRYRKPQCGFYNLFAKYLLVKSLEVSCAGHGIALYKAMIHFPCETYRPCDFAGTTLKLSRSCRVSTAVGFWLYTFIVNVNHAESEKEASSCMFYFCTALDSSIPFSTAVYIVGLGWLSIVITLQAGFLARANVFAFF